MAAPSGRTRLADSRNLWLISKTTKDFRHRRDVAGLPTARAPLEQLQADMNSWLLEFAGQWVANMTTDLSRYAIFAIGVWLLLWVVLAGLLAGRKLREATPPARQLLVEFLVSLRSIAIFSTIGLATFGLERAGLRQDR